MDTYREFIMIFALIVLGTAGFTSYVTQKWIVPFILLSIVIILAALAVRKLILRIARTEQEDDIPPEMFDALPAGCIWIAWMAYGLIFLDITPVVEGLAAYIHGSIIVALVFVSHSRADIGKSSVWSSALLVVVAGLLFVPHVDTVSRLMSPFVLYAKIVIFYVLFVVTEVAQKLKFEAMIERKEPPSELERIYAAMIQIVQTAWVLLSISPLFILALIQVGLIGFDISKLLANKETLLPTRRIPQTQRKRRPTRQQNTAPKPAPRKRTAAASPATTETAPAVKKEGPSIVTLGTGREVKAALARTSKELFDT